jgi:hypothetical protein
MNKNKLEPKAINFEFTGNFNRLVNIFFNKIKPICGIVKYKLNNWKDFPSNLEQAKSLSLEWSKQFDSNEKYSGLKVYIYFHLEKNTIRFELKESYNNQIIYIESQDVLEEILSKEYLPNKIYTFNCEKTNYFENFDIEKCKLEGKNISEQLELKFKDYKFVVFLNLNKQYIKVNCK